MAIYGAAGSAGGVKKQNALYGVLAIEGILLLFGDNR